MGICCRPLKTKSFADFPAHTTYDQLTTEQQIKVLNQLARQATRLCDCQLDRLPAHGYMVRVAVPIEHGRIDAEYGKLITRRYLLRPRLTIRSRVISDTLRTNSSMNN